jgi:uncharacterized membrane protein YqjE
MADRMSTQAPNPTTNAGEPTVTSLLGGIVNDVQELIKQQLQLFKHELKDDMKKAQEGLPTLGVGVTFAMAAVFLLGVTIATLLSWAFPNALPYWVSFLIVTVLFGASGGILLYVAKKDLESLPMSREAAKATEENVEWLTKPK